MKPNRARDKDSRVRRKYALSHRIKEKNPFFLKKKKVYTNTSAVQMDTENLQNVTKKLSEAIMDLYGGLERMKHSNALCVKLAHICLSIRKTILVDSTVTPSQIRRATAEIEGLRERVKTWEGKSLAWWYLFRTDVNARLTSAIESLTALRLNKPDDTEIFPVFPTRRLYSYMYDRKSSDPMVDYATFDFGAPLSPDIKDNWQSNVPAIVTEMDMVAKAINLYDELTHLLRYYDEHYKDLKIGFMEEYRVQPLLPSAIDHWNRRNTYDTEQVTYRENELKLSSEFTKIPRENIKKRTEQITLAKKKLADRADFPKTHGDIKFLKERWADRKAYLIDTISELGALDSDRKLARLRDSLQNAKIEESTSSKNEENEAYGALVESTMISTEGVGNFLTISILEGSNRGIVERAIDVLAPYLKKWDEKKDALSQGLRQIGYEPRGTEKSRSERTVVSSDERSDSAIERFNLCQTELENQRRNLADLQKQVEHATASDTAMRKRVADLTNVEDELHRCQTEMERMKFSDTEMKKRMAESVKRTSDLDRKLSDLEGMEAKLRRYEKELESCRAENKLHLAKTELHLAYAKYIELCLIGKLIYIDNEDDPKIAAGDRKFESWLMEQGEHVNKTLPPLIEKVDRLCGVSERKKFMGIILDNMVVASLRPRPLENGSVIQKYAQVYEELSEQDRI